MPAPRLLTEPAIVRSLSTRAATGALAGLVLAMIWLGLHPEQASALYYHPGSDPLWRGFGAQLVHLNTTHLLLNLAVFLVSILVAGWTDCLRGLLACLLCSAAAVAVGLAAEQPPVGWYVGLSGALYGANAWLALAVGFRGRTVCLAWAGVAICAAIGAKAFMHIATGSLLEGMPVAYSAHSYGFIGGMAYALCAWLISVVYRRASRRLA